MWFIQISCVYFDKDLSWKPHVDYINKKISKASGALSKLRHCIVIDTLKTIYHALVNSYLKYGLLSWGNASDSVLQPLNVLNNRILRIITFAPLGRLDTSIIYKHLNILSLEKMFFFEASKFIFKSKNQMLPLQTIATHFRRSTSHRYFTRSQSVNDNFLVLPLTLMSSYAQKSIQMKADKIWSDIPSIIREGESFNIFKFYLKKHLISS